MQSLTASLGALRVTHWHQVSAPVAVAAPPRPASSRGALAVDAAISSADRRERRHLSLRKTVRKRDAEQRDAERAVLAGGLPGLCSGPGGAWSASWAS